MKVWPQAKAPLTTALRPVSRWKLTSRAEENIEGSSRETLWFRVVAWAVLAAGFGYVLTFLRRDDLSNEVLWILHLKGYMMLAAMHGVLIYIYLRMCDHVCIGPGIKKVRTQRPMDDASPVRLTVTQNGVVTGADEGYVWLNDGTLFYKGFQTAFRLNADDTIDVRQWPRRYRPNPSHGKLPDQVLCQAGSRVMDCKFKLLEAYEDYNTRRRTHEFQMGVYKWLHEKPEGSLESLLPPRETHAALRKTGWPSWEPVYGCSIMVAVDLVLAVSMNYGISFTGPAKTWALIATIVHAGLLVAAVVTGVHCLKARQLRAQIDAEQASQQFSKID